MLRVTVDVTDDALDMRERAGVPAAADRTPEATRPAPLLPRRRPRPRCHAVLHVDAARRSGGGNDANQQRDHRRASGYVIVARSRVRKSSRASGYVNRHALPFYGYAVMHVLVLGTNIVSKL